MDTSLYIYEYIYTCLSVSLSRFDCFSLGYVVFLLQFPEDVQARMLADAEALEQRHRQRVKELKRQKFIRAKKALYSKLKFYGKLCTCGCWLKCLLAHKWKCS